MLRGKEESNTATRLTRCMNDLDCRFPIRYFRANPSDSEAPIHDIPLRQR